MWRSLDCFCSGKIKCSADLSERTYNTCIIVYSLTFFSAVGISIVVACVCILLKSYIETSQPFNLYLITLAVAHVNIFVASCFTPQFSSGRVFVEEQVVKAIDYKQVSAYWCNYWLMKNWKYFSVHSYTLFLVLEFPKQNVAKKPITNHANREHNSQRKLDDKN